MAYGVTSTGFAIKLLPQITSELQAAYQGVFGQNIQINQSPPSLYDQIISIHANREAAIWQMSQALYLNFWPDTAQGVPLANVVSLTGQSPLPAVASTVTLTLTGTNGTTIPSGSQVTLSGTTYNFATNASVTIAGGTASVVATCTVTGPVVVPVNATWAIATPVAGWTGVSNAAAGTTGQNVETDAALRARRANNLTTAAGSTANAIRLAVLAVPGVTSCSIAENRTDVTDSGGRPPHSFQITVSGTATNLAIANAIWAAKDAGINTYGSTSVTVQDTAGNNQVVNFSTAQQIPIYVTVSLTRNPAYPNGGDSAVANAILAYGNTFVTGQSVTQYPMMAALQAAGIPGIDRADVTFGTAPGPTSDLDVAITGTQIATFTLANIVVQ